MEQYSFSILLNTNLYRKLDKKWYFVHQSDLHNVEHFHNTLKKKYNILCEYVMIKKALSYFLDYFDNTFARYVKIESELYFLFKNNNVSFVKKS